MGGVRVGALTGRLCITGASTAGRPGRHGSYRYRSTAYIDLRRRSWDNDHSAPDNYYGDAGSNHLDKYDTDYDDRPHRYDNDYGATVHH